MSKLHHKTKNTVTKCTACKWVLPKAHNNLDVGWECLQPKSVKNTNLLDMMLQLLQGAATDRWVNTILTWCHLVFGQVMKFTHNLPILWLIVKFIVTYWKWNNFKSPLVTFHLYKEIIRNKGAHSALCRSPEEKIKGHNGAIYRGPLMLYTKYQGSSRFLQKNK